LGSGIASGFKSDREVTVRATSDDGGVEEFRAIVRIDTPQEIAYVRHGGILHYVLRRLAGFAK
jgi:aconitate hydratase